MSVRRRFVLPRGGLFVHLASVDFRCIAVLWPSRFCRVLLTLANREAVERRMHGVFSGCDLDPHNRSGKKRGPSM